MRGDIEERSFLSCVVGLLQGAILLCFHDGNFVAAATGALQVLSMEPIYCILLGASFCGVVAYYFRNYGKVRRVVFNFCC